MEIKKDREGNVTDFGFIRKKIKTKDDLRRLDEIKEDWHKVRKENRTIKGNFLFSLRIGRYTFWFTKKNASSSTDTYLEIFQLRNHMRLKNFLGRNDEIIVDVGANEGFYTFAMKENNPNLKIISIEPIPSTYRILKKNVEENKIKDVILVNKAITRKKGKVLFETVPGITVISSHNIQIQKRPWLSSKRIRKVCVESIRLVDLCKDFKIKKIDILKIDVEGNELDVLKSAKEMLKNIKKIVIEWHTEALKRKCIDYLEKRNFSLIYEEKKRRGDLYFLRKN